MVIFEQWGKTGFGEVVIIVEWMSRWLK